MPIGGKNYSSVIFMIGGQVFMGVVSSKWGVPQIFQFQITKKMYIRMGLRLHLLIFVTATMNIYIYLVNTI